MTFFVLFLEIPIVVYLNCVLDFIGKLTSSLSTLEKDVQAVDNSFSDLGNETQMGNNGTIILIRMFKEILINTNMWIVLFFVYVLAQSKFVNVFSNAVKSALLSLSDVSIVSALLKKEISVVENFLLKLYILWNNRYMNK